jgi:hypothetical protein
MTKSEQVGFHKGSVSTLVKEREELVKMVTIVDQLIKMHVNALKGVGVDITKKAKLEDKVKKVK